MNRKKTEQYNNNILQKTKYFALGNYEEEIDAATGVTTKYCYIGGGDGLVAIYKQDGTGGGMMYVHKDVLGSIDVLTRTDGKVIERYSYSAWGRRRNASNWTLPDTRTTRILSRGFTGQEHL